MVTMLEATVQAGPKVVIRTCPIPSLPSPKHILIRVVVTGTNPKDWKNPNILKNNFNQGDDIAGIVHSVGSEVLNFRPGDRVAAFHEMLQPGASYAEYALAPEHTTFHLGPDVPFEDAATVPLAGMTAALGLYQRLKLNVPWAPLAEGEKFPLIVYGAASAVGAFAIKMAVLSNIHPIICVAGRGRAFVETIIDKSKGDIIIDYRDGDDSVVKQLDKALEGKKAKYVFDAVSEKGSIENLVNVMATDAKMVVVLPGKSYKEVPQSIQVSCTQVGKAHSARYPGIRRDFKPSGPLGEINDQIAGGEFFQWFGKGLREGWFKPHPYTVIPGGLGGLEEALSNLRDGKASGMKYIVRIAETEGLGSGSTKL